METIFHRNFAPRTTLFQFDYKIYNPPLLQGHFTVYQLIRENLHLLFLPLSRINIFIYLPLRFKILTGSSRIDLRFSRRKEIIHLIKVTMPSWFNHNTTHYRILFFSFFSEYLAKFCSHIYRWRSGCQNI